LRRLCLEVLCEVESKGSFADEPLSRLIASHPNDKDKALATELVKGTLCWRGRLDYFLGRISKRPLSSLPTHIRNALRLGAYQILFLDRVPRWAAVDESVKLARRYGHEGHVKFVNAVLRNLIRSKDKISLPERTKPVPYLAAAYSFPPWLVKRWFRRFGFSEAGRMMEACNTPPGLTLRVNRLRISPEALMTSLTQAGLKPRPCPLVAEGLEVTGTARVTSVPGFDEGLFYIQDPGAMLVSHLLGVRPGERVLDACAAPGGKATHLAELMEGRGAVIALERDEERIALVRENLIRLGIESVRPRLGDGESCTFPERFDRILIDAPCSGLGTIRRHPEAKWLKQETDLVRHQERQLSILNNISGYLRKGGVLVYATCSTEPEENEEVIRKFLEQTPGFTIDRETGYLDGAVQEMFDQHGLFHAYPHVHGTDGFFAVKLVRQSC
jgi:16S rRNA (cytosine967-C5)-methyltransferase